jgi:hypothetical protein
MSNPVPLRTKPKMETTMNKILNKTILALAALATIGTAALAPTSASALSLPGFLKKAANTISHAMHVNLPAKVAHNPVINIRKAFNVAVQIARHELNHKAPAAVRFVPSHRPLVDRIAIPAYHAPVRFASAAPAYRPAMKSAVNGMNVTMVAVPNGQFSMSGEGQWVEQTSDGKSFEYTEANRDGSSVTLVDAARGIEVTLDLGQREVFYAEGNGPKRPLYPIVQVSAK